MCCTQHTGSMSVYNLEYRLLLSQEAFAPTAKLDQIPQTAK